MMQAMMMGMLTRFMGGLNPLPDPSVTQMLNEIDAEDSKFQEDDDEHKED